MNISPQKNSAVFRRELLEFRSPRSLGAIGIFALLQFFVSMGARQHGRMEDTLLVFLVGGLAAVIICFDLVAREREHHTLDLLLTQGLPRAGIFLAKWLAGMVFSLVGAAAFCLGTVAGTLISGYPVSWGDLLPELGMVAWVMAGYAALALACSVVFRRSKTALIAAAICWVTMRPAVISMLIIDPLQRFFGWDKNLIWRAAALIPEFSFRIGLDASRGMPKDVDLPVWFAYAVLTGYVLVFSLAAWLLFRRQDEPTQ